MTKVNNQTMARKLTNVQRKTTMQKPQTDLIEQPETIQIEITKNDYLNIMVLMETGAKQIANAQLAAAGQESMIKASNVLSTCTDLLNRLKQQVEK